MENPPVLVGSYAGIGSRFADQKRTKISDNECEKVTAFAKQMQILKLKLFTGGATGIDTAFANGVTEPDMLKIITAKDATQKSIAFTSNYHPAWLACNDNAQRQHGRNAMLVMGELVDQPMKFVACWTKDPSLGGTSQGLRIAKAHEIPIFNLYGVEDYSEIYSQIEKLLIA